MDGDHFHFAAQNTEASSRKAVQYTSSLEYQKKEPIIPSSGNTQIALQTLPNRHALWICLRAWLDLKKKY